MSSLVEKGNTIHVPAELLGGEKSSKFTVTWSQNLRTRNQEYYTCTYTVKSGGNSDGLLYIQADKIDEFKSRKIDGDDVTLMVDESFQYGQNRDKTKRFLVYHDTDNRPYQHRFVDNMLTGLGKGAIKFLGYLDVDGKDNPMKYNLNVMGDMAKNFVGDYLHSF